MEPKAILPLRPLPLAGAALLLLAAASGRTHAAFVFTLTETGGDVVVNGSGTLNTTELAHVVSAAIAGYMLPSFAILVVGPRFELPDDVYQGGGLSGPAWFGPGQRIDPYVSSGTGNHVGISGLRTSALIVPRGYLSGTALTNSATFAGHSFASLGFAPGTYTYTWGSGANADSLTIIGIVPEPCTAGLTGAGLISLLVRRKARRA